LHKRASPRLPHAVGNLIHRLLQRQLLLLRRKRRPILDFEDAVFVLQQLARSRTFGAEVSLADRALGFSLDLDHLAVLVVNQLPTTHSTIRTY